MGLYDGIKDVAKVMQQADNNRTVRHVRIELFHSCLPP